MKCFTCGKQFNSTGHYQKHCSKKCRYHWYYLQHKKELLSKTKKWWKENSKKARIIQIRWRTSEKGKKANRKTANEWAKNHKEYVLHNASLQYAKRRNAKGSYTANEWRKLKEQYDYKCQRCGRKEPEIKLTKDHIIPISKGGENYIKNIQPLCMPCNASKREFTN